MKPLQRSHLTEEEIALIAEKIKHETLDEVDSQLRKHVSKCDKCAGEVLMVYNIKYDSPPLKHTEYIQELSANFRKMGGRNR